MRPSAGSAVTVPGLPEGLQFHVRLYAPFDGAATAAIAQGNPEPLVATGLRFEAGKVASGLSVAKETRCAYATTGNFHALQGTVMMWFKRGAGSDALFTIGPWYRNDFATLRVVESQDVIHSHFGPSDGPATRIDVKGVPKPDEWHHIAITWDRHQLRLFFDGNPQGAAQMSGSFNAADLADRLWIGTSAEGNYPANSVIDELCILDVPLTADQLLSYADPVMAAKLAERMAKRRDTSLRTLFHLDFDGTDPLQADQAVGNPAPTTHDKLQIVPGLSGQGVLLQGEAVLAYEEPGNLDKDYGSFEMWFKFAFDETNAPEYPCFFMEDAPLAPLPADNIWLWMQARTAHGTFRCDRRVGPNMDDVIHAAVPGGASPDIWHQLVLTWDSREGQRLFIDGLKMPNLVGSRPFGIRGFTWTPIEHPRFFLGNRGRERWGACESVLDEFSIYSRPLTTAEVAANYASKQGERNVPPLILARCAAIAEGEEYRPLFDLKNRHGFPLKGKLDIELKGGQVRQPVLSTTVNVPALAQTTLQAPPLRPATGRYALVYTYNGRKVAQQFFSVLPRPTPPTPAGSPTLVGAYDAVAMREEASNYRESVASRVGTLGDVRYVEAGAQAEARLAFRFAIKHPGRPHLLRVFYPDDQDRAFDIIVNSPAYPCTYDTQGGVLTGREFETTGAIQHYDLLYWPREQDQALFLTTWVKDAPAAISGFEVSELQGTLPPALAGPGDPQKRRLGLYWEDPMLSEAFGGGQNERDATRFTAELADRMVEYLRATGQNQLIYPITFYPGPNYLSLSEDLIGGPDVRHPEEYVDLLLKRFEQAGAPGEFGFVPSINCCLSPSMLLPIEQFVKTPDAGYLRVDNRGNMVPGHFPQLNVLHPLYKERLTAIIEEMCQRWGKSPAFKGVQFLLGFESSFWMADIRFGYDDFSYSMFGKDTDLKLPIFSGDDRCKLRYDWLMNEQKAAWLDWRCRKVTQFYSRLARLLAETRPDLKLIVGLRFMSEGDVNLPLWENAGRSMEALYRGAGLDFDQLAKIPNLELQMYSFPADMAWRRSQRGGNGMYNGLELRRSDELRSTLTRDGQQTVSTNVYVEYFESGIDEREPIKDLWWKGVRYRAAGLTPSGRNYLEQFSESIARYDAPMITTGGAVVGTMGHQEHIVEFAKAYRALPAERFETIQGSSDTAVVRVGEGGYLYVVSRSPFPVTVHLRCPATTALTDLSDQTRLTGPDLPIALAPFQLRSFQGNLTGTAPVTVVGYDIPPARRAQVQAAIQRLAGHGPAGAAIAELCNTNLSGSTTPAASTSSKSRRRLTSSKRRTRPEDEL